MGENDFTANGEDDLRECVSYIKRGCEEYAPLAERQLIYMTDYEVKNNGIHVATYEDGVRMIGNFSDAEAAYEGDVIEPYGYIMK
jgi:hypothetical protein